MGAGAAAIIAARHHKVQGIVDAFRLGDATSPDRARRLDELGIVETREARDLIAGGVLAPGEREGTYYLSEARLIYERNERKGVKAMAIVAVVLLVVGVLLISRMVAP